jgi:hypothetical protein
VTDAARRAGDPTSYDWLQRAGLVEQTKDDADDYRFRLRGEIAALLELAGVVAREGGHKTTRRCSRTRRARAWPPSRARARRPDRRR